MRDPADAGSLTRRAWCRLPLPPPRGSAQAWTAPTRCSAPVSGQSASPLMPSFLPWDLLKLSQLQYQRHFCLRPEGERAGQSVFCVLDGSSPRSMDPWTCSVSPDGHVPSTALKPRKPKSLPLQPKWTDPPCGVCVCVYVWVRAYVSVHACVCVCGPKL